MLERKKFYQVIILGVMFLAVSAALAANQAWAASTPQPPAYPNQVFLLLFILLIGITICIAFYRKSGFGSK